MMKSPLNRTDRESLASIRTIRMIRHQPSPEVEMEMAMATAMAMTKTPTRAGMDKTALETTRPVAKMVIMVQDLEATAMVALETMAVTAQDPGALAMVAQDLEAMVVVALVVPVEVVVPEIEKNQNCPNGP